MSSIRAQALVHSVLYGAPEVGSHRASQSVLRFAEVLTPRRVHGTRVATNCSRSWFGVDAPGARSVQLAEGAEAGRQVREQREVPVHRSVDGAAVRRRDPGLDAVPWPPRV